MLYYLSIMATYTTSDFRQITWEQYEKALVLLESRLTALIKERGLKIHAVVPILRGGAIPGQYLGYKLGVLRFMPVQYKYFKEGSEYKIKKIGSAVLEPGFEIKDGETILVAENNHCFGTTAKKVVEDLKEEYPSSKIIYAAVYMDFTNREAVKADLCVYGEYTNETGGLSAEKVKEMGLPGKFGLYPWENVAEEMAAVNSQPFMYN